ncbi:flavin-containing monooxygenase [Croceicoccus bisphenolivorans]|uniref:flavin-containing monooxygenase n=1 Tax=Croceicoccus bisphenolivorans TaxID=1783232 RepID=UPI0008332874|nr:NAD(P)/FAD-dependent oxidoreductase [Croceicoccus bisphenolivorans]
MTRTCNIDCLIIGGGQAGLAMSYCLSQAGIDHVVIERGRIGERWRSERWPSLRLLTPGWMTRMPGRSLASRSDGFLSASDLVTRLETYAKASTVPLVTGTSVLAVERIVGLFRVATTTGTWLARSVVIATGACDRASVPASGAKLGRSIFQLTPDRYITPDELPQGGVLVVGASATGVQLAREIARSGRRVVLSAGSHVRTPRNYRGRDLFDWLDASGFLHDPRPLGRSARSLASQPSLQLVGDGSGRDIDLYRLSAEGVTVTGRAIAAHDTTVGFADTLADECAAAERRRYTLLARIDAHIAATRTNAPVEPQAWNTPAPLPQTPEAMNLRAHGIASVLWATGFRRNYPWLHVPVLSRAGEIVHHGGVTRVPGVYALGLPFMRHRASTFIDGVGRDAEALAPHVARHLGATLPVAA